VILAVAEATWFGIAAAFSSIIGIVLAILSHLSNKKTAERKAAEETHAQLLAARAEAEKLSEELHKLRMERNDQEQS
jgi:hypothetical protein